MLVYFPNMYFRFWSFNLELAGWAPHTYFLTMAAERNDASAARINSLRIRRSDVETPDSPSA